MMRKLFKIIVMIIIMISISSNITYGQSCKVQLFLENEKMDFDSLKRGAAFIFQNRIKKDMPFYEQFKYVLPKGRTHYFALFTESKSLKYSVETEGGNPLNFIQIKSDPFALFKIEDSYSGNYYVIAYDKNPDNECAMLQQLLVKDELKNIEIPSIEISKTNQKNKLELLRTHQFERQKNSVIPFYKEFSYVLTKGHSYFFEFKDNTSLKLSLENVKREIQPLIKVDNLPNTYIYNCEKTGIYYYTIYNKESLHKSASFNFYVQK